MALRMRQILFSQSPAGKGKEAKQASSPFSPDADVSLSDLEDTIAGKEGDGGNSRTALLDSVAMTTPDCKGKGKSSAAFGMIFRCIAHQLPCAVVQFIKGGMDTGERNLVNAHFADLCAFHTMGEGFTWETQDKERDIAAASAAWATATRPMSTRRCVTCLPRCARG